MDLESGELHNESPNSETYHFHISCKSCLRPIEEPVLDCEAGYPFPDKSQNLKNYEPGNEEDRIDQHSGRTMGIS